MAEMQSATRTPGTQGPQASTRQDGHDTAERNDHMQETAKEMRDKAQDLMTQGGKRWPLSTMRRVATLSLIHI